MSLHLFKNYLKKYSQTKLILRFFNYFCLCSKALLYFILSTNHTSLNLKQLSASFFTYRDFAVQTLTNYLLTNLMQQSVMTKGFWLIVMAILGSHTLYAQKYSNEFLSIGLGARAQGMGGAMVAHVNDATSSFWNPAGLHGIDTDIQIGAKHAEWFGGIGKYDYVGFGMPLKNQPRYIGFSFIRFGVDGIPNTLSLYEDDGSVNYSNVTDFSAADYAFLLNYAQTWEEIGLSIGVTPKIIHRKVGPFASSWGFGADIGAQYQLNKSFQFGLLLKDITTTFNAWRFNFTEDEKDVLNLTGNEIPIKSFEITRPQIILGGAYMHDFFLGQPEEGKKQKTFGILTELDLVVTTDGRRNTLVSSKPFSMDPAFGMELDYNKIVFLRAGVNNFQQFKNIDDEMIWSAQPNFGVGFRIYKFRIDYALTNLGGNSGVLPSHIVSIRLDINYDYIKQAILKES